MAKKTNKKKEQKKSQKEINYENLLKGISMVRSHPILGAVSANIVTTSENLNKKTMAIVDSKGNILANANYELAPGQWAFVLAHNILHLAFGHFDADKMPGYNITDEKWQRTRKVDCNIELWNMACDIYVNSFLKDIKFGISPFLDSSKIFAINGTDEIAIYNHLITEQIIPSQNEFGTAAIGVMDMNGLNQPVTYKENESNRYTARFVKALAKSVQNVVSEVAGKEHSYGSDSDASEAANWFLNHYPLLGGVAAHFKLIENENYCNRNDIHIAAIDVESGELYINPCRDFTTEQWKFILAHEYLHAGLDHHGRCNGRDPYLWNVACDYVINGWLVEMQIGAMPDDDLLYDDTLKGLSAESIYDMILENAKKYEKMNTLRGFRKGDFYGGFGSSPNTAYVKGDKKGVSLDEFCRDALRQGLEYHSETGRGLIPAGLIEEIRALAMPPIPWDVELAKWFDNYFEPLEKHRTYARPSRRQASTPHIPRPSYYMQDIPIDARTFGVVIDTSGSMEAKQIGKALGSIASYAVAHDVPFARVIFCDAAAYDAGYLSVEDVAGRINVIGRGGTILQPGVNLLENAPDFPKDGPILIITDGAIEDRLDIKHTHAFLIPKGNRLPFRTKADVFYFD